jgi:tetrapyrrole methylase family protein / MazG family protein
VSRQPLRVTIVSAEHLDDLPDEPVVSRAPLQTTRPHRAVFSTSGSGSIRSQGGGKWRVSLMHALDEASVDGSVIYATLGHPMLGDATIQHLLDEDAAGRIELELFDEPLPMVLTEALASCAGPVSIVDSLPLFEHRSSDPFAGGAWPFSTNQTIILTNVNLVEDGETIASILDRRYRRDSAVWISPMIGEPALSRSTIGDLSRETFSSPVFILIPSSSGDQFQKSADDLQRLVATLRAPGGCPWDREQTNESLAKNLIEESYELLDAIESGDADSMKEELGDYLLQALMHCQIAEEEANFTLEDVIDGVVRKLVRRHPHVFADAEIHDSSGVLRSWDEIKRQERETSARPRSTTLFGDIPRALPALMRAQSLMKRASRSELDPAEVQTSVHQALLATERDDERTCISRMIAVVEEAQHLGIDLEQALRSWSLEFERVVGMAEPVNESRS